LGSVIYLHLQSMILEVAILDVKPGMTVEFEANFKKASTIIASMSGYISHELQRCIETENRYILLVRWQKLEDHTIGFRQSPEYQEWRAQLHHFYEPFPIVEHYQHIFENSPIDR
jgi:heme-degrading monooxygenase HmoA